MPQENAYVERIQGTIKNDYLCEMTLTQLNLGRVASHVMRLYNNEKPHRGLGMVTPEAFEKGLHFMNINDHPEMQLYQGFTE